MDITYHKENGYLIPNIVLAPGCDTNTPIGKYGRMRWRYLQGHRPVLFNVMVQSGTLFDHLIETENAARSRLDVMIPELAKSAGATEKLKAVDQMKWVGIMNSCKIQAEEIICQDLIFH